MKETKENAVNLAEPSEQLDTQPADNGAKSREESERKFTQEEVNRIVQDRLQRERSKANEQQEEKAAARSAELEKRESRLACKEYLLENGLPSKLIDVIDTSNPDHFKHKAQDAASAFETAARPQSFATPMFTANDSFHGDTISQAFSRESKHMPRSY